VPTSLTPHRECVALDENVSETDADPEERAAVSGNPLVHLGHHRLDATAHSNQARKGGRVV
jgi:hypothetical protein